MNTDISQRKTNITPASAGLAGLVIGVIAGATAVVVSDQKTRQRVQKSSAEFGRKAQAALDEAARLVNATIERTKQNRPPTKPTQRIPKLKEGPTQANEGGELPSQPDHPEDKTT